MFPGIKPQLSNLGEWKKHNEPCYAFLGGFGGDATAYPLMVDGYVDEPTSRTCSGNRRWL